MHNDSLGCTREWISTVGFLPWEPTVSEGKEQVCRAWESPKASGVGFEEP